MIRLQWNTRTLRQRIVQEDGFASGRACDLTGCATERGLFDDSLPDLESALITISVLIPQYSRSELTLRAVHSLRQHHPGSSLEILVVDDGSTASARRSLYALTGTTARVLVSPRRRGVTAAWNLGAGQAQGDVLIFLNNDTVTTGRWCEQMAMSLDNASQRIVGPEWRCTSTGERQIGHSSRLLAGWCLGMTRSTFQELQGFDERFFLYFSDTDLQFRACSLWPDCLKAVPTNSLRHFGHQTTRHWEGRHREWNLDQQRFLKKWIPQISSSVEKQMSDSDLFAAR